MSGCRLLNGGCKVSSSTELPIVLYCTILCMNAQIKTFKDIPN
jgi:hypothetical protein